MTAPNPHEPAPVSAPVDYDPATVEAKWQNRWRERGTNHTDIAEGERPFYALMMFPYPSAEGLHVGNLFAFTGNDIYGRFQRLQGHTVFEPIGFDAFGIHSENYALKVGVHPAELIPRNIANFRRQLKRASVVALVGSLPHSQWINPSIVAAKVADVFEVDSYQITAPVMVDDPALRDLLWAQPTLQDVRQRAAAADIALLTVGDMSADATIFRHGIVPSSLIAPLKAKGAVANMLCYFVDAAGRLVDHEVNGRVMAIGLDVVSQVPNVVLAAGGKRKVAAILAALKAVSTNVLITDSDTATALLAKGG